MATNTFPSFAEYETTLKTLRALFKTEDINAKDGDGDTALHYIAREGYEREAKALIACGANIKSENIHGYTPLHCSAQNGHVDVAKIFLDAGADIDAKDGCGKTPLHYSSQLGHAEVVRCLIAAGVNINAKGEGGYAALHYSAGKGYLGIVNILLAAGADADARNKDGWTPLHCSAQHGQSKIVKTLIAAGADANAKLYCSISYTPLHFGAHCGHLDTVRVLIEAGVDVNALARFGETPLMTSAQRGHLRTVKALIAAGADLNAIGGICLSTALHESAQADNVEIIKALIAGGADINITDRAGETPLCTARCYDNLESCKVLIKHTILMNSESNEIKNLPKPRKLFGYWKACKEQVTKMKNTKLGDSSVSLFTFLTETDKNRVAFYSSEDNFGIRNEFKRAQYKKEFPMYDDYIEDQFKKGSERASFLDKITNKMAVCFSKKLPIKVCRMISEHLSDDDLTCFLFSFKCKDNPGAPPYKKIKL